MNANTHNTLQASPPSAPDEWDISIHDKVKLFIPRIEHMIKELLFFSIDPTDRKEQQQIHRYLLWAAITDLVAMAKRGTPLKTWNAQLENRLQRVLLAAALDHVAQASSQHAA